MRTATCLESAALLTWEVLSSLRFWKKLCISMLCFIASTATKSVSAQKTTRAAQFKAQHSWSAPLRIEPRLSGNFGELRGNHFHTGVDLKTEGREGLVVIAATDGQVSRIKMSPWGYGNALYLDGPDGVTTVYAHLQRFAPKVQSWAVERTYAVRSLGLDASPPASAGLHFQAGDTLGWSGNSGGSGGPHLHFEIRSTANQHPLNPLDGWLDKVDNRPPVLPVLWVESPSERLRVTLPVSDTLVLPGKSRLAIEGYDLLDGASNICGLRTLEAQVTSESGEILLTHRASWDELDFGVNKDMNAHAFYPVWSTKRDQVHRLHRLPTNRLGIYSTPPSEGWVELAPGTRAELRVAATDAAGNATSIRVPLVGGLPVRPEEGLCDDLGAQVHGEWKVEPGLAGTQRHLGFQFAWKAGTFFESETMRVFVRDNGRMLALEPTEAPYRKSIQVQWPVPSSVTVWEGAWSILPGDTLPSDRWLAVQRKESGEVARAEVASWLNEAWEVDLPRGGEWTLERDTVPPKVLPYHSASPLVATGDAVWFVDDALSGVREIDLRLDGRWARVVWDPKRNMVTYQASDGVHARGRSVKAVLTVEDEVGNVQVWKGGLVWP